MLTTSSRLNLYLTREPQPTYHLSRLEEAIRSNGKDGTVKLYFPVGQLTNDGNYDGLFRFKYDINEPYGILQELFIDNSTGEDDYDSKLEPGKYVLVKVGEKQVATAF